MQSVPKLIRQIREALVEGRDAPLESLASDYAQLCQEANQRLESCEVMLEKGSEYQALQLAETDPALLDLIGDLSFAEASDWIAYCQANQLPVPPRFDAQALQTLDDLYARGISISHPLYKDYRAAVTSRDDIRALHVIRSIVRLNPEDANAKAELVRIENKLYQIKLQELRATLTARDETGILADVAELERLATPSKLASVPEYARAVEIRREVARREAMDTADRLVETLDEERQAQAWRMVGDILARLRALQAEHGFVLREKQATKCVEMQQYFDAQRAAAEETGRFERALYTAGALAENIEHRLRARSALTFEETQKMRDELDVRWEEVERFQRPAPEAYAERVQSVSKAVRGELSRLQRARRLRIVGAAVAAMLVIIVASWFTTVALRVRQYTGRLEALQAAGSVDAAAKLAAELRASHGYLAAQPKLAAQLGEIDRWTVEERTRSAQIDQQLAELETAAKGGFDAADPFELATKLDSTGQLIDALAADLRPGPSSRLLVVRKQFDAHLTELGGKLNAESTKALGELETEAGARLSYDQPKEAILQALAGIGPKLEALEKREKPPVAALALPEVDQARVASLRQRVDLFRHELDTLTHVNEDLLQANSLDTYLHALAGYKDSHLNQAREVNDARKLLATLPKPDDLLASLLLPDDPDGWAAARADTGGASFMPDSIVPVELTKLMAPREDNYLANIWEVSLIDFRHKGEHRELYARGDLKREGPNIVGDAQVTRWIGAIYDPSSQSEIPGFVPETTITLERGPSNSQGDGEVTGTRLSGGSSLLNRLELNRLTDATGVKYERSLLRLFDEIVHDKAAHPIFKAYLMQQLRSVLMERPYVWGLEYCPSLRNDLAELDRRCGQASLRSQDWLLERKRAQLAGPLTAFFHECEGHNYFAEAGLRREVLRATIKAGLQFGGFISDAGTAVLNGEARGAHGLWVLAPEGRKLVRFTPPSEASKASSPEGKPSAAPFSPVFYVPIDRDALLRTAARDFPNSSSSPPQIPVLDSP